MNYTIQSKPAFRIVGRKERYDMNMEECFSKIPTFWQTTIQQGLLPEICSLMNQEPYGVMGVGSCMDLPDQVLDYYIAVSSDKQVPDGMYQLHIPEATWAIFECIGAMPTAIHTLSKKIMYEWFPASGYERANAPDIELYFEGDQQSPDYKCEVWVPIVKKSIN